MDYFIYSIRHYGLDITRTRIMWCHLNIYELTCDTTPIKTLKCDSIDNSMYVIVVKVARECSDLLVLDNFTSVTICAIILSIN